MILWWAATNKSMYGTHWSEFLQLSVYRVKSSGEFTEPYGAPVQLNWPLILTTWCLPVRNEWTQRIRCELTSV